MKNLENLIFCVTFFKEEESKELTFSCNVNLDEWDDPKEFAIFHVSTHLEDIRSETNLTGFLPKFKTFKVLRSAKLSDLGLA